MTDRTNPNCPEKTSKTEKQHTLGNLEIASFCDQLSMIISAGLPAYEGISILMEDAPDDETKKILHSIYAPLEIGGSFHEALKASGVFPKYVLDMVEIGEMSGKLEDVLRSLSHYYQREQSIRDGIRNAVTYPLLMVGIMIAVLLVLIAKVLPIFNQIYTELGSGLTGFARTMMNLSFVLNKYFAAIIVLLVLLLAAFFVFSKTNAWKTLFQGRALAMSTAASRFANCMTLALSSGLDTSQGIELALQLVDNPHMAKRIRRCQELMESGTGFSESILSAGIFSRIYASLITIGFKTGSMDQVMDKIAKEYEDEIDYQIGHFISILEPSLVIILSVLIGIILISFLLPLLGIMTSIG